MALASLHDGTNHGNSNEQSSGGMENGADEDKHFRPNPDAKPFIPNPLALAATNLHFYPTENGKNMNGVVPPFWVHQQVEHEDLIVPGSSTNPLKKHIAFHLVSNVLDDEIHDEVAREPPTLNNMTHPHSFMVRQERNMYGSHMNDSVDTWQTLSSNFTLPLDVDRSSSDKSSINNKSIHEIWSPNPSPNGLNNLSPSDEVLSSYNHAQQQFLDSPNSVVESPDVSVEQHEQNEFNDGQSSGIAMYDDMEKDSTDEAPSSPQYWYQNLPSPVYTHHQYNYPSISHRAPDMYPTMLSSKNNVYMENNISPVVVEHSNYYNSPQYLNKYQVPNNRVQMENRYYEHQPLQTMYDLRISCVEELGIALDENRDQLKHLEGDCRKTDTRLSQEFRPRKTSVNEMSSMKYPSNSTRVDKLLVDQQKEHQKVESLIGRIERLGFTPMHPNVGVTLDLWLTSIRDLRNARKNEMANLHETHHIHSGMKSHTQADVYKLISSVKDLTKHTRSARTIVWCAIQMLYAHTNGSGSGE